MMVTIIMIMRTAWATQVQRSNTITIVIDDGKDRSRPHDHIIIIYHRRVTLHYDDDMPITSNKLCVVFVE